MERDREIENFSKRVTFFIEPNGLVTIDYLFTEVLMMAFSLDPDDERIKEFISHQVKGEEGGA